MNLARICIHSVKLSVISLTEYERRCQNWSCSSRSLEYAEWVAISHCSFVTFCKQWQRNEHRILYNNEINARALIGQSAMVYCASKLMEKSRVVLNNARLHRYCTCCLWTAKEWTAKRAQPKRKLRAQKTSLLWNEIQKHTQWRHVVSRSFVKGARLSTHRSSYIHGKTGLGMSKNNLIGITLVTGLIWGTHSFTLTISWLSQLSMLI